LQAIGGVAGLVVYGATQALLRAPELSWLRSVGRPAAVAAPAPVAAGDAALPVTTDALPVTTDGLPR